MGMRILVAGRRRGKTFSIIEWWLEDPSGRAILVVDEAQRNWLIGEILRSANKDKFTVSEWDVNRAVITPFSSPGWRGSIVGREIMIDNLDMVLRTIVGGGVIVGATSTQDYEVVYADGE